MKMEGTKNNAYIIIIVIFLLTIVAVKVMNYLSDPALQGGTENVPKVYSFTLTGKDIYSIIDPQKSSNGSSLSAEQEEAGYFYLERSTNGLIYVFGVSKRLYDHYKYGDKIYVEVTEMPNGELKYRIKGEIVNFIVYKDSMPTYTQHSEPTVKDFDEQYPQ